MARRKNTNQETRVRRTDVCGIQGTPVLLAYRLPVPFREGPTFATEAAGTDDEYCAGELRFSMVTEGELAHTPKGAVAALITNGAPGGGFFSLRVKDELDMEGHLRETDAYPGVLSFVNRLYASTTKPKFRPVHGVYEYRRQTVHWTLLLAPSLLAGEAFLFADIRLPEAAWTRLQAGVARIVCAAGQPDPRASARLVRQALRA